MADVDGPVPGESEDELEQGPAPGPRGQTLRHKVIHYADRVFFVFLALLLLVLSAEVVYKVWYITNWSAIGRYLAYWLWAPQDEEAEL